MQNLFNYQAKIIKMLADKESCVIIGRCADFVLKDRPNVLKVYVHAPFENCVKTTMEIRNLDQAEAEISQLRSKAAKESALAAAAQLKKAQEQSEKLLAAAQQSAQMERKKMLSEAREEIAQLAVEATQKLLKTDASKIYEDFLDAASKEQNHE